MSRYICYNLFRLYLGGDVVFGFIETAEGIARTYAFIGLFGTIVFVILNILIFIGLLDEMGLDVEIDLEAIESSFTPMKMFTFRGVIAFFMFFGWTGYLTDSLIWAILVGAIAFYSVALVYHFAKKLQHKGNFNIMESVGREATVYLRLKADYQNVGKVHINLAGGIKEMNATSEQNIEYGCKVIVTNVQEGILVVRKIEEEE